MRDMAAGTVPVADTGTLIVTLADVEILDVEESLKESAVVCVTRNDRVGGADDVSDRVACELREAHMLTLRVTLLEELYDGEGDVRAVREGDVLPPPGDTLAARVTVSDLLAAALTLDDADRLLLAVPVAELLDTTLVVAHVEAVGLADCVRAAPDGDAADERLAVAHVDRIDDAEGECDAEADAVESAVAEGEGDGAAVLLAPVESDAAAEAVSGLLAVASALRVPANEAAARAEARFRNGGRPQ